MMLENLKAVHFWYERTLSFRKKDQLEFMAMFNSFLDDGDGLKVALESTQEAYADVYGRSFVVVKICEHLLGTVKAGRGFDALLKKYFAPTIAIGFELSKRVQGDKSKVLGIIDLVETENRLKKESLTSMATPLFMFFGGILISVVMGGIVIPQLEAANRIVVDTPEALLAKGIAYVVNDFWFILVPAIVLFIVGLNLLQAYVRPDDKAGFIRSVLDNVWPFNLYKIFWSIRVARLLGYLKLAEVKDVEALKIIKKFSSRFMGYHIDILIAGMQAGKPKQSYFGTELFMATQLIRIRRFFTKSDNTEFAKALVSMSYLSEKDVEMQNRNMVTKYVLVFTLVGLAISIFSIGAVIDAALMAV